MATQVALEVLRDAIHAVFAVVPHVRCTVLRYAPTPSREPRLAVDGSVRCALTWNGDRAGACAVPTPRDHQDATRTTDCPREFALPVQLQVDPDVASGERGGALRASRLALSFELSTGRQGACWGRATLEERAFKEPSFECDVDVLEVSSSTPAVGCAVGETGRKVGTLRLRLRLHRLPAPGWRRRQLACELYVARLVEAALRRVPQPRVEIALLDVAELPEDVAFDSLECFGSVSPQRHISICDSTFGVFESG